jgi:lipid-binding SYLF domain-containing protein
MADQEKKEAAMKRAIGLFAVLGLCAIGCAHQPTKPGERADLKEEAQKTLAQMEDKDPGLRDVLDRSVAFIVFPAIGQGGFLIGGGAGNGVVYEDGQPTVFAHLKHLDVGAVAGGERYAQVIAISDPAVLQKMKNGEYDFGASASAVIVRSGAAAATTFRDGVAVFRHPIRGAMVNASLSGQKIRVVF